MISRSPRSRLWLRLRLSFRRPVHLISALMDANTAATVVARGWRNREKRRLLRMIPDMETLRALFLDEEARRAGAESNVLYTGAALKVRAMLRHSTQVRAALTEAWRAIVAPEGKAGLSRAEYFVMSRKLFLWSRIEAAEGADLDVHDAIGTAYKDWCVMRSFLRCAHILALRSCCAFVLFSRIFLADVAGRATWVMGMPS